MGAFQRLTSLTAFRLFGLRCPLSIGTPAYQRRLAAIDYQRWHIQQQFDGMSAGRNERARFRPSRCSDVGKQSRFLWTVFWSRATTSARGSTRRRLSRDLEIYIPLTAERDAEMHAALRIIPKPLTSARISSEMAGTLDLWNQGGEDQSSSLTRLQPSSPTP